MADFLPLGSHSLAAISIDDDDDLQDDRDRQVNRIYYALRDPRRRGGISVKPGPNPFDQDDENSERVMQAEEDLSAEIEFVDLSDDDDVQIHPASKAETPAFEPIRHHFLHAFEEEVPRLVLRNNEVVVPGSLVPVSYTHLTLPTKA